MRRRPDTAAAWRERLSGERPPGDAAFVLFTLALAGAAWLVASLQFVPLLDHVNLAMHEAGHVIFGLFGELPHWLGGTLGQFVFPLVALHHFARRGEPWSMLVAWCWLFENFRYTAVYVADARSQALPLVGGGQHDWAYLLGRFGWLEHDQSIAAVLTALCWLGWLLAWAIVADAWWRGRGRRAAERAKVHREAVIAAARERGRARDAAT